MLVQCKILVATSIVCIHSSNLTSESLVLSAVCVCVLYLSFFPHYISFFFVEQQETWRTSEFMGGRLCSL